MCVHDCIHPLWEGTGVCQRQDNHSSVCFCDAGYASRDAAGNPSCVPQRLLLIVYLLLAAVSAMVTLLVGTHIFSHRNLPAQYQHAHKTTLRMSILKACSIYVLGYAFIGVALAVKNGRAGYLDDGFVQIIHILLLPSILFAVSMVAEYWVATIPPQLISPDSLAAKLRTAAVEYRLFIAIGSFNAGTVAVFGIVTIVHPLLGVGLADLAITSGVFIAMMVILFVAFQITRFINQAMAKAGAGASSRVFYVTAKKRLWQQALGLIGNGVIVILAMAFKHLTPAGRNAPVIPYTIQVLTGHIFSVVFTVATRFSDANAPRPSIVTSPASRGIIAGCSTMFSSPRKLSEFKARLALGKAARDGGSDSNPKTDGRSERGISEHRGGACPIELETKGGYGVVGEGGNPDRGSGLAKISRVIPVVLSPTVSPSGGEELESFREEDDISCTYAQQLSLRGDWHLV